MLLSITFFFVVVVLMRFLCLVTLDGCFSDTTIDHLLQKKPLCALHWLTNAFNLHNMYMYLNSK